MATQSLGIGPVIINNPRGFTLIELLVVMLIISIVTSISITGLNRYERTSMQAHLKTIRERLLSAKEEAMLRPAVIGVSFSDSGYQFFTYDDSAKEKWVPIQDDFFKSETIPNNFSLTFANSNKNKNTPAVVFSMNGGVTPFTLTIGKNGSKPLFQLVCDENGEMTIHEVGDEKN